MKLDFILAVAYGLLMFYLAFFMTPDLALLTVVIVGGIVITASIKAIRRIGKGA